MTHESISQNFCHDAHPPPPLSTHGHPVVVGPCSLCPANPVSIARSHSGHVKQVRPGEQGDRGKELRKWCLSVPVHTCTRTRTLVGSSSLFVWASFSFTCILCCFSGTIIAPFVTTVYCCNNPLPHKTTATATAIAPPPSTAHTCRFLAFHRNTRDRFLSHPKKNTSVSKTEKPF